MALLLALLPFPALAQTYPAFTGLVVDAANVLPPDREAALTAKLENLQQRTNHQLVVATVPDLQGRTIEDYGVALGRTWGVGLKQADNGAILLVAPTERKVRIEVGRALQPIVTDAFSSILIRRTILPAFRAKDLPGGIEAGADALIAQLSLPDVEAAARAAEAAAAWDAEHRRSPSGGGFGLAIVVLIAIFVMLAMVRRAGGRRYTATGPRTARRQRGGGGWPIILWGPGFGSEGGGSSWGGGSSEGGGWGGGGFTGGGGGSFDGGGASGSW